MAESEFCELCDLPKAFCVHGQPPPKPPATPQQQAEKKVAKKAATSRRSAPSTRSSTTRSATGASRTRATVTAKPVVRRWTPPEVFAPLIVDVLREAGGELEVEDAYAAIEERVGDGFREGDRETTPEGELRWQYAARRARQALITQGSMVKARPGLWVLSEDARLG